MAGCWQSSTPAWGLGKVFEAGYELVPLGAIERVPLVSFVASVIGMIMSGFLAWALCAMALHKWTTDLLLD